MWVSSLKLFFSITFIFVVAHNEIDVEDIRNCSLINGRLSTNVSPLMYITQLQVKPDLGYISGNTDITIDVQGPITRIIFNARNIEVNLRCTTITTPTVLPKCKDTNDRLFEVIYCTADDIVFLIFDTLAHSGRYLLHIEHISTSDKYSNRLNYTYGRAGTQEKWLITNIFTLNSTRELFPSWNDPAINSAFKISIQHNRLFKAFSSVPTQYISIENDNLISTHFKEIRWISTYSIVIALVSGIVKNSEQSDIHSMWYEPEMETRMRFVSGIAGDITKKLQEHTNIIMSKYIQKIDHIILPNSPMKSAGKFGVVIYRENDIAYNKTSDFYGRRIDIAKLVTYEITRQLFVAYKSLHLIKNWWLNEILSSFYSYHILNQVFPGEKLMELFVVQNLQTALDSEVLLELEPIIHKAKYDDGIDGLLYPLLYHKKAFAIMRMFVHIFFPQNFDEIVKKFLYLRTYDLWDVLLKIYPLYNTYNITDIMRSWLTEIHHPEMLFIRNYNESTVRFRQILHTKIFKSKIPLSYATPTNIKSYNVTWYEGTHTVLIDNIDPNQFFLANVELIGYYRVNYDSRNWQLLSAYLQSDNSMRIPVLNRAQIVNDAFYFVTTYDLEPAVFFDVIQFLKNETNYIVWYPMFNILSYMSAYLELPISEATKAKFLDILDGLLQNVGYKESQDDKPATKSLRLLALKWACKFGHTGCRKATADKMIAHLRNPDLNIIPSWANWMYCTGMMGISTGEWSKAEIDAVYQKNIALLETLSCTENEEIIFEYLKDMIETDLGWNTEINIGKIYGSVVRKHVRRDTVLNYVLRRYIISMERFSNSFPNGTLMSNIILNLYSEEHLDMLSIFANKHFLKWHKELWFKVHDWIAGRRKQLTRVINKFRMF